MTIFSQSIKKRPLKIAVGTLAICFSILGMAKTASAAVLYQVTNAGTALPIKDGNPHGNYSFYLPMYTSGDNPPLGSVFYTPATSTILLKVQKSPSTTATCDQIGGVGLSNKTSLWDNSGFHAMDNLSYTDGNFCTYRFSGVGSLGITGIIFAGNIGIFYDLMGSVSNIGQSNDSNAQMTGTGGFAFQLCDLNGCSGGFTPSDTTTRIDTVTPANNATIATGTVAFEFTGYVNPDDYSTDMTLQFTIANSYSSYNNLVGPIYAINQIGAPYQDQVNTTFTFPINSSGAFDLSTSTTITQIGRYSLNANLSSPRFNFLGFSFGNNSLVSTSTSFLVSTTTLQDEMIAGNSAAVNAILGASNSDCDKWLVGTTTFSQLPARTVIYCAIAPTTLGLQIAGSHIYNALLTRWPIGYITRLYDIGFGNSTSSLPVIHYIFPSFMPIVGGMEWDIPPWDDLSDASKNPFLMTDLDLGPDHVGQTIWDIMQPIYDPIIYALYLALFVAFIIYNRKE